MSVTAAAAVAAALGVTFSAQELPTTPWGDPDLRGVWVGSTLTPLERPSEYEGRQHLTEEEVAALEIAALAREERLLHRPAERAPAGGDVDYRPDGRLGADAFWFDEGTAWVPSGRTSLIGLAGAAVVTRLARNVLFEVGPLDPLSLIAATALLVGVALAANWLPARRAAGVEPVRALRTE